MDVINELDFSNAAFFCFVCKTLGLAFKQKVVYLISTKVPRYFIILQLSPRAHFDLCKKVNN